MKSNKSKLSYEEKSSSQVQEVPVLWRLQETGEQIINWYTKFVIRNGKQHTGLCGGQMHSKVGLDFHSNASLAVLNALCIEEQAGNDGAIFPLTSIEYRHCNQAILKFTLANINKDVKKTKNIKI